MMHLKGVVGGGFIQPAAFQPYDMLSRVKQAHYNTCMGIDYLDHIV